MTRQSSVSAEEAARLSWQRRAWPLVWLGVAFLNVGLALIYGHGEAAITMGALILSKLAAMENAAWQRAVAFAWQSDRIARRLRERS